MTDENQNRPEDSSLPERRYYQSHYEWTGDKPLSLAIIEAIAEFEGVDYDVASADLPPLQDQIDVETLDALAEFYKNRQLTIGHISLEYAGYAVMIHNDGLITVKPPADDRRLNA